MRKQILAGVLTATLTFAGQPIISDAAYKDVPATHQNYSDIMFLLERGIINDSNVYGISDTVTRQEVAVMVAKALELDGTKRTTDFKDIPVSHINSGYIQSAVEAGIIKGYPDGTFKPNNKVTRGQMAAFLGRAFDLPASSTTFKDVKPTDTGAEFVGRLAAAKITTGYGDGTFKPYANLTRAHISAFIARAVRYEETGIAIPNTKNNGPAKNPGSNNKDGGPATQIIKGAPTSFKNCDEMRKYYPNGVKSGHPAYSKKQDRDGDGVACEV
ncbi:MAG: S-layer homology domain-containing protein [Lysinibacillus sp.]